MRTVEVDLGNTHRSTTCNDEGAAVAHGNLAYFNARNSHEVFAYNSENNDWSKRPECPERNFGLAVVNNLLTAVGGYSDEQDTYCLHSFSGGEWVTVFLQCPPSDAFLLSLVHRTTS